MGQWQLTPFGAREATQDGSNCVFYNLILKPTCHRFRLSLLDTELTLAQYERGRYGAWTPGGRDLWGPL